MPLTADMNLQTDRRKHKRFTAPEMAFVQMRNGLSHVGPIIDVSRGGLSFKYLAEERPPGNSWELDVLLSERGFLWSGIPHRTVIDFEILPQVPFSAVRMRRRGIAFGECTGDHALRLEFLLESAQSK
jgi:hypothetical protein